jgi:ACR3 family arsenite efflux pump ArsB
MEEQRSNRQVSFIEDVQTMVVLHDGFLATAIGALTPKEANINSNSSVKTLDMVTVYCSRIAMYDILIIITCP